MFLLYVLTADRWCDEDNIVAMGIESRVYK